MSVGLKCGAPYLVTTACMSSRIQLGQTNTSTCGSDVQRQKVYNNPKRESKEQIAADSSSK